VAVREGGADPAYNGKLREIIAKAKANNIPNDNIDRAIKKAAGSADGSNFDNIFYEGYGPSGVAVMVETLTDNRNRTAGDLRHYFDKYGGNLGQTGSVSFLFNPAGLIVMETNGIAEEKIMEDALLDGVTDLKYSDEVIEIYTEPASLNGVRDRLMELGYRFLSAESEQIPVTETRIEDSELAVKMGKLLELLEDNDDVHNVWHNWEEAE
jgi:YebC/PmpR family DNA-binding regulatory protein